MAVRLISCLGTLIALVSNVMPKCEATNFPLKGCSTDDMDMLFLYFYVNDPDGAQEDISTDFVKNLRNLTSSGTTRQMLFAEVIDKFSAQNHNFNVSSWQFRSSLEKRKYGGDDQLSTKQKYMTIEEIIGSKVAFVQHLFSEMTGVRENVTHVGVIFLNGIGLSYEDSRSVSRILQQQRTSIKVFVVVLGGKHVIQLVYLSDTLLLPVENAYMYRHILNLAMCNQCMEGWWSFEHQDGTDFISCYKLYDSGLTTSSSKTHGNMCFLDYGGVLATLESQSEVNFLRHKMYNFFKSYRGKNNNRTVSSQFFVQVYVGLLRDSTSVAKRFQWAFSYPTQNRPFLDYNWFTGKPLGGASSGCAVWKFAFNNSINDSTFVSGNGDSLIDGWVDVECRDTVSSLSLCEVVLPRRIEEKNQLRIHAAKNASIRRALGNANLFMSDGNIVSVSVNIPNKNVLKLLKETNKTFPVFDCGIGSGYFRYVSYLFVCDSIDDCSNRGDETFCSLATPERTGNDVKAITTCNSAFCCDGSCLPTQWINDGEVDCSICWPKTGNDGNDENKFLNKFQMKNISCAFVCDQMCVQFSQLNDSNVHCRGPEGPLDETIGKLETADTCYNVLGHRIWASLCVYIKDKFGAVLGCRDMSHLKDCRTYECPEGYFKCPNTYCIPQHYVLDGKADCPTGEEEQIDLIDQCHGNFACWNSKICLHPDLVCDGHPECPYQDDELDCHVKCAQGFRCVSGTITVSDYNKSIPLVSMTEYDERTRYLDFSGVDLSLSNFRFLSYLKNILIIILSYCKIDQFSYMCSNCLNTVQTLDMSYNLLQTIDGREIGSPFEYIRSLNLSYNKNLASVQYLNLKLLENFDLSYTSVTDLDGSFFAGLPSLKYLNLSFTVIYDLNITNNNGKLPLNILDLRGVPTSNFHEDFFHGLAITEHLYTDRYELCCPQIRGPNIPYYTCHAPDVVISSCFDLIGVNIQRVFLWVFAAVAVMGNLTVIVYRVHLDRSVMRTGYGLFVTNLGISDFIMGVYLLIIAGADHYYRDVYVLYDKAWRESLVCRIAGFLATLSNEASTIFIFLITLDRYLAMNFPFGQSHFSQTRKLITTLLSWMICFLLALIPIVFRFELYSSNAMCLYLPLTISTKQMVGWEYSFSLFVVVNCFLFLVIACGQRAIFRAISKNRIKGTESIMPSRRTEDILVAKQLSLIALSNFLCWFPVGLMGFLTLSGQEINNEVYVWTTVIVLPINSAANPLLYTIPVLMVKWEKFKNRDQKPQTLSLSVKA